MACSLAPSKMADRILGVAQGDAFDRAPIDQQIVKPGVWIGSILIPMLRLLKEAAPATPIIMLAEIDQRATALRNGAFALSGGIATNYLMHLHGEYPRLDHGPLAFKVVLVVKFYQ